MKKYFTLWWKYTIYTTQIALVSRFGIVIFTIGKLLRFFVFLFFLLAIIGKSNTLGGYSVWQMIFFYATFNLIDTLPQFFLREVYRFRNQVVSGAFDGVLLKPISPLFRSLFGGSDILDLSILLLSLGFIIYSGMHLPTVSIVSILLFVGLVFNAFIIALALHIIVLSLGIRTSEVDNTIMIYRDITQMGRFPIDIYREPIRSVITFIIPVGIMMTFPAKAMMGVLSVSGVFISFSIGIFIFFLSLIFWRSSLRHYTSASS